MKPTLKELLEYADEWLKTNWEYGRPPLLMGITEESEIVFIPLVFRDYKEKQNALINARIAFAVFGVDRYLSISESWMSFAKPSADIIPTPSRDPNRTEVVMALAVDRNGTDGQVYTISNGLLEKMPSDEEVSSFSGTFTELLPEESKRIPKLLRDELFRKLKHHFKREQFKFVRGGKNDDQ